MFDVFKLRLSFTVFFQRKMRRVERFSFRKFGFYARTPIVIVFVVVSPFPFPLKCARGGPATQMELEPNLVQHNHNVTRYINIEPN